MGENKGKLSENRMTEYIVGACLYRLVTLIVHKLRIFCLSKSEIMFL